jgi:GINS complex subunit 2
VARWAGRLKLSERFEQILCAARQRCVYCSCSGCCVAAVAADCSRRGPVARRLGACVRKRGGRRRPLFWPFRRKFVLAGISETRSIRSLPPPTFVQADGPRSPADAPRRERRRWSCTARGLAACSAGMESSGHAAAALGAFQQAEFLAEDELIEISPMVVSGTVALVCGDFGPFEPSIATKVPLWLALAMKKLRRCRIIPPRWLALREVERCIQDEREQEGRLQPLPRFFSQVRGNHLRAGTASSCALSATATVLVLTLLSFPRVPPSAEAVAQIAAVLLHHAEDDLEAAGRLRRAVEDLCSLRAGKMRRWMQTTVRDRMNAIKVNNLTSLEVETHRPVLTRVLDGLYSMHVSDLDVDPATQSASAGTSSAATGQQRPLRRIIRRT